MFLDTIKMETWFESSVSNTSLEEKILQNMVF